MRESKAVLQKNYETVIGLEVHVELATRTKIFCACSTAFGAKPNAHTCPVCAGMPGTLPVLNRRVLELAIAVGLATNCEISRSSRFDRKNYFYPDNPQNYQISQLYLPICRDGYLMVPGTDEVQGNTETSSQKKIRIHEIHMEEDAGKLIHDEETGESLVDYNRAGVPLIEIVTEPDMASAEDVIAILERLRTTIQYLGASDCKLQEGSMRVDVNISVREPGTQALGTRTELKNLSSFRAIRHAIAWEGERQYRLLQKGELVLQETRRWDENKEESFSMRSKEDSKDYRYFPEPDVPPIHVTEEFLQEIKATLPEFREARMTRYEKQYQIPAYDIEQITSDIYLANLFEKTVALGAPAKKVSNWIMVDTMRLMRERNVDAKDICISPEYLAKLIGMTEDGKINSTIAKEVFEKMFDTNLDPQAYVQEKGLLMVDDTEALRLVVEQVIASNPQSVEDYRNGKERAIGFLVGQTMKAMKGKANPTLVTDILREML